MSTLKKLEPDVNAIDNLVAITRAGPSPYSTARTALPATGPA